MSRAWRLIVGRINSAIRVRRIRRWRPLVEASRKGRWIRLCGVGRVKANFLTIRIKAGFDEAEVRERIFNRVFRGREPVPPPAPPDPRGSRCINVNPNRPPPGPPPVSRTRPPMNTEPVTVAPVVAEPVPEPKCEVPPMPESVWVLLYMRKNWIDGEWGPGAMAFPTREQAIQHLKWDRERAHKREYHRPHIVRMHMRSAEPDAPTLESLAAKLAEIHAANAELRAKIDAMTT